MDESTPKDYSLIIYNKTEIDEMLGALEEDLEGQIDSKSDNTDEGSPSGIATLDPDGKVSLVEIPIATVNETEDSNNNSKLMTPNRTHQLLNDYMTTVDADDKYGNLESDGSVEMDISYVPQEQHHIATVKYVQDYVASSTTTYIKNTLAEMFQISPIVVGDICYVVSDGDNDGQYIAISASTEPTTIDDWEERIVSTVWGSITGDITTQDDLQNSLELKETVANVNVVRSDLAANTSTTEANAAQIDINTTDISNNTTQIGVNTADIASLESDVGVNTSTIASNVSRIDSIETKTDNITVTQNTNLDTVSATVLTNSTDIVANTANITKLQEYQTGFDLRDTSTLGILELCGEAASGEYWRIDESNVFTKITGATTFGDGVTQLVDRTFCHRPFGAEMSFYINGVKHTKTTAQTIQLNNIPTKQIITYDIDTAELSIAEGIYDAITENCMVSVVTGNPTILQKVIFANERHGKEMSSATHMMLHETDGTKYGHGLSITGLTKNGTTFTSIASGTIWDEDIEHGVSATTEAPFAYRDTNGYWSLELRNSEVYTSNELAFTNDTGVDSLYNRDNGDGSWSLVDTGSDYVINHIFATNDAEFPILKVVGQTLYPDRNTARNHLSGEMAKFKEGDLPTPEFLHLYSYILDGNGNIEVGLDDEVYVDFRQHYPIGRY